MATISKDGRQVAADALATLKTHLSNFAQFHAHCTSAPAKSPHFVVGPLEAAGYFDVAIHGGAVRARISVSALTDERPNAAIECHRRPRFADDAPGGFELVGHVLVDQYGVTDVTDSFNQGVMLTDAKSVSFVLIPLLAAAI